MYIFLIIRGQHERCCLDSILPHRKPARTGQSKRRIGRPLVKKKPSPKTMEKNKLGKKKLGSGPLKNQSDWCVDRSGMAVVVRFST